MILKQMEGKELMIEILEMDYVILEMLEINNFKR